MRCAKARENLSHQMDEQLSPEQIGDLDRVRLLGGRR